MKKNTKKATVTPTPKTDVPKVETPKPEGARLTEDLITRLRSAANLDAALVVLAPPSTRAALNATYRFNAACTEPLPARRGAGLKVIATAIRLDKPFTSADVVAALPELKAAKYWLGRLVKSGHLEVV